jgi:hypothetical protein
MSGEDTMVAEWTYEGYWNAVLGDCRDAARVVSEFALVAGLDECLGQAEVEAWRVSGGEAVTLPSGWAEFHKRALEELEAATA